jgi:phospholipid/cholesterol/gamma-HCH transport system substrate-binding protein
MSANAITGPVVRTTVLVAFAAACLGFLSYLYAQAGGTLPFSEHNTQYRVSFESQDLGNLVPFADVVEAGVRVGKVDSLQRVRSQSVRIVLTLDTMAAPLHEGAVVEIIERSLIGQPAVKLTDGTGPAYPNGTVLPAASVRPPVTVREVLSSMDAPSRNALGGVIRSLGSATDDRRPQIAQLAGGLAAFGNQGDTALAALAAQSADLVSISRQLRQIFDALDTGQGQIADLVTSANKLTRATAGQRPALEDTLRTLPGVMDSATTASGDISRMATALGPAAADLRQAAPNLNDALNRIPDTTRAVRATLPPLHTALHDAPPTLTRVPKFADKTRDLFPLAVDTMRQFNPMARYIKPRGPEIAQFFANFGAALNHYGEDGGAYLYVRPMASAISVRPNPIVLPQPIQARNPYPQPGGLADLRPFTGRYPRIEPDN